MEADTKKFIQTLEKILKPARLRRAAERGGCVWFDVRPQDLVAACQSAVAAGAAFDSAFVSAASRPAGGFILYYLLRAPAIGRMLVFQSTGKAFGALSATHNAALWDERKIQDLTGLSLSGIPDARPLIFHPESGMPKHRPVGHRSIPVPVHPDYVIAGTGAEGEYEAAVGPVHAGIIEPGHFRAHVVGEQFNKLEIRMFYLHRGIEQAAEGKPAGSLIPLVESISGDESVASSVAYCQAVERAAGIAPPLRAESIRAVLLELERIYSHLSDLGGMPTDVGFTFAASRFAVLREDMMRLNARICGSRFLRGRVCVGGVTADLDEAQRLDIKRTLSQFIVQLEHAERITLTSSTYLDRVFMTGAVSPRVAADLALLGPVARAVGVPCDLRRALPYGAYARHPIREPLEKNGDVLSRFTVKLAEAKEAARLARHISTYMHAGPLRAPANLGSKKGPRKNSLPRVGAGWAEAPRGGTTFLVELNADGTVRRLACRTPSFRNWRGIEKAVMGNIVPDFPLINKSFNMSYAGTDL
ncbi:MAG: hydrogenase large subunit [Candidatus Micrarchaeota archaeon]|nr:hydrogenase large subunit [Candidatus Micrarchaeota archaeon]